VLSDSVWLEFALVFSIWLTSSFAARASVLTGRTPRRDCIFGVEVHELPAREFTIAQLAQQNGYRTFHAGKWHLGSLQDSKLGDDGPLPVATPFDFGFDSFCSTPQCGCSANTNCGCLQDIKTCDTGHYKGNESYMVFPCQQYFRTVYENDVRMSVASGSVPTIAVWPGKSKDNDQEFLVDRFEEFLNSTVDPKTGTHSPFLASIDFHR
jgi:hypothetical protein